MLSLLLIQNCDFSTLLVPNIFAIQRTKESMRIGVVLVSKAIIGRDVILPSTEQTIIDTKDQKGAKE